MHILALEPFYGGSHRAFLDGWSERSSHTFTTLGLPPYKWKWRMRHAAVTFADQVAQRVKAGESWDRLFASDMLNLAEFRGLAPAAVARLPTVLYFHENQLTYPVRQRDERDYHFAMTNFTSALAADALWFNSNFHRDEFFSALDGFLGRMPDNRPTEAIRHLRAKSSIHPPAIEAFPLRDGRRPGPLRILWASRWEHDKDPETLFEALRMLAGRGVDFRASVLGESFQDTPEVFESAKGELSHYIDQWGYLPSREAYRRALAEADVIVSTAQHEFFGIAVVEAIAAGCFPLLPDRLSYPEIIGPDDTPSRQQFFYDGEAEVLANRLESLADQVTQGLSLYDLASKVRRATCRYCFSAAVPEMDAAIKAF